MFASASERFRQARIPLAGIDSRACWCVDHGRRRRSLRDVGELRHVRRDHVVEAQAIAVAAAVWRRHCFLRNARRAGRALKGLKDFKPWTIAPSEEPHERLLGALAFGCQALRDPFGGAVQGVFTATPVPEKALLTWVSKPESSGSFVIDNTS
jgi:hypothetical protein